MAKDDYFVIAYQILSYLYQCLKNGADIDERMLQPDSRMLKVNERYWTYILFNLSEDGYIDGVDFCFLDGGKTPYVAGISDCMITPKGIEYLCENSSIKKAFRYLKDIKESVPFNTP